MGHFSRAPPGQFSQALRPVIEDDGTTTPSAETRVAAGATARRSPEWVVEDGAAAEAMPSSAATADRTTKVVVTPSTATLFPKGLLHTSTIAHIVTSKFALGTPHYRLEQALADHGVPLDRGLMSRYVEHAGNTLGATLVAAMWRDAIANGHVISTDATGALIQPSKAKDGRSLGCKKGHFFTAVVDADAVLFHSPRGACSRRSRLPSKTALLLTLVKPFLRITWIKPRESKLAQMSETRVRLPW